MNYFSILKEEIYGNMATVYHRSPTDETDKILKTKNWIFGKNAGNMYGKGVYTVFNLADNSRGYGSYLYKFHVKGLSNFFIFIVDECNKVNGTHFTTEKEIIDYQNKKFNLNVVNRYSFTNKYKHGEERNKVAGIIYHGNNDGDCCLIWDPEAVIPVSISYDNGKTWEKIRKNNKYEISALNKGGTIKNKSEYKQPEETKKLYSKEDWELYYIVDNETADDEPDNRYRIIHKNNKQPGFEGLGIMFDFVPWMGAVQYGPYYIDKDDNEYRFEDMKTIYKPDDIAKLFITQKIPNEIIGKLRNIHNKSLLKAIHDIETTDPEDYNKKVDKANEKFAKSFNDKLKKSGTIRIKNENMPSSLRDYLKHCKANEEQDAYKKFNIQCFEGVYYKKLLDFSADFIYDNADNLAGNRKVPEYDLNTIHDEKQKLNSKFIGNISSKYKNPSQLDTKYGRRTKAYLFYKKDENKKCIIYKDSAGTRSVNVGEKDFSREDINMFKVIIFEKDGDLDKSYKRAMNKTTGLTGNNCLDGFDFIKEIKSGNLIAKFKLDGTRHAVQTHKRPFLVYFVYDNNGEILDTARVGWLSVKDNAVESKLDVFEYGDEKNRNDVKNIFLKIIEENKKFYKWLKENNKIDDQPLSRAGYLENKRIETYGREAVRNIDKTFNIKKSVKTCFDY